MGTTFYQPMGFHTILQSDPKMVEAEAWKLAEQVTGMGSAALGYSKEDREQFVPGWGPTLHATLQSSRQYVVSQGQTILECLSDFFCLEGYLVRSRPGWPNSSTFPYLWLWSRTTHPKGRHFSHRKLGNPLRLLHLHPQTRKNVLHVQMGSCK